jgi:hypothetical protein
LPTSLLFTNILLKTMLCPNTLATYCHLMEWL